jgi:ribosomal protein L12E/L44/L45/RPP1/RPP2
MRSIHNAEVDLNYTLYYPLLKTYVSLYPRQAKDSDKSAEAAPLVDGPKGDVNMWKTVEKAMEDQTLEDLRESREGVVIPGAPARSQPKAAKKSGKSNKTEENKEKTSGAGANGDEDEDSDDGFFA